MVPSPWQLDERRASLQLPEGSAVLDTVRPGNGMRLTTSRHPNCTVFKIHGDGLDSPLEATDPDTAIPDTYVRGNDLVVTFGKTRELPFSLQTYWRAIAPRSEGIHWGLELILSAQTLRIQSHARVCVESLLNGTEILNLRNHGQPDFETLDPVRGPLVLTPSDRTGCFVFRAENALLSYVEMIHPLDFTTSKLERLGDTPLWSLSHTTVNHWMEKGVILRGRLRGILVPRQQDLEFAGKAYEDFCAAKLSLTT